MHPRRLRCSSLTYSRYARSSRLAGGAPRPSRCDARLSPRAARTRSERAIRSESDMTKLQMSDFRLREQSGDDLHDLLAVEPAVLDEDGSGVDAGNRTARNEQPGDVGLERRRIEERRLPLVE